MASEKVKRSRCRSLDQKDNIQLQKLFEVENLKREIRKHEFPSSDLILLGIIFLMIDTSLVLPSLYSFK